MAGGDCQECNSHARHQGFFNVARHNVHLYSTYVPSKVVVDLLYHGVLILNELFVCGKYFSKEYIP